MTDSNKLGYKIKAEKYRLTIINKFKLYKRTLLLILIIVLLVTLSIEINLNFRFTYDEHYPNKHEMIFQNTETDIEEYNLNLKEQLAYTNNNFALGDIYLILARLENSSKYYRRACREFEQYYPETIIEKAILYETLASLNCNDRRTRWMHSAMEAWSLIDHPWREELIREVHTGELEIQFDTMEIYPRLDLSEANRLIIGMTSLEINQSDFVMTQADRVFRDWLSYQMQQSTFRGVPLTVFSEREYYDEDELRRDLGWHEGGLLTDIQNAIDIEHKAIAGTIAAFNYEDGKWYAPDENGVFRFSIPEDKIYYPTTRFLSPRIAVVIDTHGINMLVDQAMTEKPDVVIGCCDHPGKMKAAIYLSENNISVICNTDRFLYRALGHNASIISSSITEIKNNSVVFGKTPIEIRRGQKIAVLNIDENIKYPYFYYAAPYYYFKEISKTFPLEIFDYKVVSYNKNENLFQIARENNITLAGYRVFNSNDYNAASRWLEESKENKIILFHSSSYPFGKLLAKEYPYQVGFGDVNPYIVE